jgi:membrane-associated protein
LAVGILAAAALALSLAGLIRLPDLGPALTHLSRGLGTWTYLLVAGFAFLETAAFVGLVAPGETALALGGVVAAHGRASVVAMILIAWAGAAAGDLVSFVLGGRVGRSGLTTYGPRLGFTEPRLSRVDAFFARYGPKAILIGRFIGVVRAIAPFLAGSTGMRLRAFVPWSLLGTATWSAAFVLVGYVFSASVDGATRVLANGALGLALVAAVILTVRARRRSHQSSPGSDEGDPVRGTIRGTN